MKPTQQRKHPAGTTGPRERPESDIDSRARRAEWVAALISAAATLLCLAVVGKDGNTIYQFQCDKVSQNLEDPPFEDLHIEELLLSPSHGIGSSAKTAVLAAYRSESAMAEATYDIDYREKACTIVHVIDYGFVPAASRQTNPMKSHDKENSGAPEVVRMLAGFLSEADIHATIDTYELGAEPILVPSKDGNTIYQFQCDKVSQNLEDPPFEDLHIEELLLSPSHGIGSSAKTAVLAAYRSEFAMAEATYDIDYRENESPGTITHIRYLGKDPSPFVDLMTGKRESLLSTLRAMDETAASLERCRSGVT